MSTAITSRVLKTEPIAWRSLRFIQQDDFKEFTAEAKRKLVASLRGNHFVQPFHVWEDEVGELWCLDGRHRVLVLEEESAAGLEVPELLPGTFLACANRQEAARLTLLYSSAYARTTQDGLLGFLELNDLNLGDVIGEIDLPSLNLDRLLADAQVLPAEEGEFDADPPAEPLTVVGDVYEFHSDGPGLLHRLVCGSSTEADVVGQAVGEGVLADITVTDPPYNVNYEGKTAAALRIENDNMDDSSFYQFLYDSYTAAYAHMRAGAPIYVFHADSEGANFRRALVAAGLKLSQCLVWVKQTFVIGRQDYHWQHEPILYGWKEGAAHTWCSDRRQTTVLKFDRPSRNADHPTMKPLDILEYLLEQSSEARAVVFDGFGGSGSLLVACEKLNRQARLVELSPGYCDVICRRWVGFMQDNQRPFTVLRNGHALTEQEVATYFPAAVEATAAPELCPDP